MSSDYGQFDVGAEENEGRFQELQQRLTPLTQASIMVLRDYQPETILSSANQTITLYNFSPMAADIAELIEQTTLSEVYAHYFIGLNQPKEFRFDTLVRFWQDSKNFAPNTYRVAHALAYEMNPRKITDTSLCFIDFRLQNDTTVKNGYREKYAFYAEQFQYDSKHVIYTSRLHFLKVVLPGLIVKYFMMDLENHKERSYVKFDKEHVDEFINQIDFCGKLMRALFSDAVSFLPHLLLVFSPLNTMGSEDKLRLMEILFNSKAFYEYLFDENSILNYSLFCSFQLTKRVIGGILVCLKEQNKLVASKELDQLIIDMDLGKSLATLKNLKIPHYHPNIEHFLSTLLFDAEELRAELNQKFVELITKPTNAKWKLFYEYITKLPNKGFARILFVYTLDSNNKNHGDLSEFAKLYIISGLFEKGDFKKYPRLMVLVSSLTPSEMMIVYDHIVKRMKDEALAKTYLQDLLKQPSVEYVLTEYLKKYRRDLLPKQETVPHAQSKPITPPTQAMKAGPSKENKKEKTSPAETKSKFPKSVTSILSTDAKGKKKETVIETVPDASNDAGFQIVKPKERKEPSVAEKAVNFVAKKVRKAEKIAVKGVQQFLPQSNWAKLFRLGHRAAISTAPISVSYDDNGVPEIRTSIESSIRQQPFQSEDKALLQSHERTTNEAHTDSQVQPVESIAPAIKGHPIETLLGLFESNKTADEIRIYWDEANAQTNVFHDFCLEKTQCPPEELAQYAKRIWDLLKAHTLRGNLPESVLKNNEYTQFIDTLFSAYQTPAANFMAAEISRLNGFFGLAKIQYRLADGNFKRYGFKQLPQFDMLQDDVAHGFEPKNIKNSIDYLDVFILMSGEKLIILRRAIDLAYSKGDLSGSDYLDSLNLYICFLVKLVQTRAFEFGKNTPLETLAKPFGIRILSCCKTCLEDVKSHLEKHNLILQEWTELAHVLFKNLDLLTEELDSHPDSYAMNESGILANIKYYSASEFFGIMGRMARSQEYASKPDKFSDFYVKNYRARFGH